MRCSIFAWLVRPRVDAWDIGLCRNAMLGALDLCATYRPGRCAQCRSNQCDAAPTVTGKETP